MFGLDSLAASTKILVLAIVVALVASATGVVNSAGPAADPGTQYVTFWLGDLRIFAHEPDTKVEIINIDTGSTLPFIGITRNFPTNPFTLVNAGDSFEGGSGFQRRVRIVADKPVTVWTGRLNSATKHPDEPTLSGNSWMSYIPARPGSSDSFGRELGQEFLGFVSSEMYIIARKDPGLTTSISIADLATNTDSDTDDTQVLSPSSAVFSDAEIEAYFISGFEDDTVRVTSNVPASVLAGHRSTLGEDWTASPPSFTPGDDGIELGTLFYTYVRGPLTVFPTQDGTSVTVTNLGTGSGVAYALPNGDTSGDYDILTNDSPSILSSFVNIVSLTNVPLSIKDYVKIESDKPVLVYTGPVVNNTGEFADVAFSVPTGPGSRITYAYAQNGGAQDLQLFGFDPDTTVNITSLSTTRAGPQHNVEIGPGRLGVDPPPSPAVAWTTGTPDSDVWWASGFWTGEMLRIESDNPITVIAGDYDVHHFGAFIPFVTFGTGEEGESTLPPVADAGSGQSVETGETVNFDGSASFDQDTVAGSQPITYEWDFDISDGIQVDDTGATPSHVYTTAGSFIVQLTFTDDDGESDTDFITIEVEQGPESAAVSIGDDSVIEGGNLEFEVSLSNVLSVDTVVTYSTADGSATTADDDYTPKAIQTLTIPAGETSGTITVATTPDSDVEPDETMEVNLTAVFTTASGTSSDKTFWTDWKTGDFSSGFVGTGIVKTLSSTVDVTYTHPLGIAFFQPSGGIDYYQNFRSGRNPARSPFTSAAVGDIPKGTDIVALRIAGSQTLEFSEEIANPVFAYVSLNGNGYAFDQDFEILSFGHADDGNDCGYWGCGTSFKKIVDLGGGNIEYQLLGTGEPHGTLRFLGAFDTLTWRSLSNENWNGFTLGIKGTADEVGFEVTIDDGTGIGTILNDDVPNEPPEAEANGPYNVLEGGTVLLSSAGSSDPDDDPLIISWDLDDDGAFDDFDGASPLFSAAGLNGPSSVTVEVQVCDGEECDTDTAVVNILVEAAPPFTETLPLPNGDACICTPPLMNQEASGVINWFAKADGASMTVSLITQSVNGAEQGDMQIDIFEAGNPVPLVSRVQPMPTTPGIDIDLSDTILTVPGDVYRVRLTRIDPPVPTPSARHYSLKFQGAVQAGLNSETAEQIEGAPARWYVYGAASENVEVRVSSVGLPVSPATTGAVTLRDPDGNVVDTQSDAGLFGIDILVQGSVSDAGLWSVEVSGMDHHYVVEKLSGSDRGIYATWLTFGAGKVDGTVQRGGLPFTGNFKVKVTNLATLAVFIEPPIGSFSGDAFSVVLPVGSYSVQVIPDSPLLASNTETVDVTCKADAILHFEIPNRDPNAVASDVTINEGDDLTLDGSGSNDPDGDPITGEWEFDGNTLAGLTVNILSAGSPIIQDDLSDEPATLTVSDQPFGATDETTVNVTVLNVDPAITDVTVPSEISEGDEVTVEVSFDDPGVLDVHTVNVDWDDGSPDTILTLVVGERSFEASHTYPDDDPTGTVSDLYNITVTLADDDTGSTGVEIDLTVLNVDPAITDVTAPSVISEGDDVTVAVSFTDPGLVDVHTVTVDWDDGSPNTVVTLPVGDRTFNASHPYPDDNPTGTLSDVYNIKVTVADDDIGSTDVGIDVTVLNVDPVITTFNAPTMVFIDQPLLLDGTFTDVGVEDTHTVSVAWGDATTSGPTGTSSPFSASHIYTVAQGSTTVTVTITDDDGGQATETFEVIVKAPGKMTGGGRVDTGEVEEPKGNGKGKPKAIHTSHGFELVVNSDGSFSGNLQYNHHGTGDKFHVKDFTSIIFTDDPALDPGNPEAKFDTAHVSGTGKLNGVEGIAFTAVITDDGEPGRRDTFTITFPGGDSPDLSGVLNQGNHQAHGEDEE